MNIISIPAFNPGPLTGAGNNTYVITGRRPALIDAGVGDPRHLEQVERALAGAWASSLAAVLVTHGHSDHVLGSEAIAARWPQAVFAKMPWLERDARSEIRWCPIADQEAVPAGDGTLRAIHTPGHAPDHLCFYDEDTKTLFCGDLVVRDGTIVIPATHGGSLSQYLRSLERVLALKPARLLPAHGPAIDRPADLINSYLAHRRQRERQVVAALESGHHTADGIVDAIYQDLSAERKPAARESVLAHLVKLEEEARAAEGPEGHWVSR